MDSVAYITSKNIQYDVKDKKARDEKLNISDLPHNVSYFNNDSGYITRAVENLINYYKKSETYTKDEIQKLLSTKFQIKVVTKLPTSDISTSTIYFLKRPLDMTEQSQYKTDVYDEYIYVDGTWELIGNTYVDLSNYYTKSETKTAIDSAVNVETSNRKQSDNILQNNINNVQINVDNVNQNLNSEIVNRQKLDATLQKNIDTVNSKLSTEIIDRTNGDNILSDRCDTYDSHVANVSNPHNVTKAQVGLGNVQNVTTDTAVTKDSKNNVQSGAVYTQLANKVDKVAGYGLSQQNYTLTEKNKLAGLKNYDDTSVKSRITATESAITKLNANSNTTGSVDYKIKKAIEGVTQFNFSIVSSLPTTGVKGTIYFVLNSEVTTGQNRYNEYVWLGDKYEQVGKATVDLDLSDVYSKAQVNALVSAKNDKITVITDNSDVLSDRSTFSAPEISAGANPTKLVKRPLSLLWNYIKGKIETNITNGITFEIVE